MSFYINKCILYLGTSFRTQVNLDKRINGSCQGSAGYFPLKLDVHICGKDEDETTCPVCNSFECYTRGMFEDTVYL